MTKKEIAATPKQESAQKQVININGKEYPCFSTLAANFDFKDVTGKEVNKIDPESITELVAYMWATIKGACYRMGVSFPYESPRELSYYLNDASIAEWSALMATRRVDGKKK